MLGNRIALSTFKDVSIWTIDVPTDPRELQRWLQTITNAQTVPGSDAYTWP